MAGTWGAAAPWGPRLAVAAASAAASATPPQRPPRCIAVAGLPLAGKLRVCDRGRQGGEAAARTVAEEKASAACAPISPPFP